MSEFANEVCVDARDRMERAVEHAQNEYATVRTGRATPALVEKLKVVYYGADVPLQQLASFSVPEARVLVCLLYTSPSPRDATLSRMPSSA